MWTKGQQQLSSDDSYEHCFEESSEEDQKSQRKLSSLQSCVTRTSQILSTKDSKFH